MRLNTKRITLLALLTALIILLTLTPLGFLKINVVTITFIAIPVIIGAIFLGPAAGAFLGLVFGLCSFSTAPGDPLFSLVLAKNPFLLAGICIIPRMLIGIVVGFFAKAKISNKFKYPIAGVLGSVVNTTLFVFLTAVFTYNIVQPALASLLPTVTSSSAYYAFWGGIAMTNGIPEAIASGVLVSIICIALKKAFPQDFS